MALIQKISNYLNFGKQRNFSEQTNFDAGKQPSTSEEAARKSGYNGRIKSDDTTKVAKPAPAPTPAPKAEAPKVADVKAPELTPPPAPKAQETAPKAEQSELAKFNAQRQAAMEKQGNEALANLTGEAKGSPKANKAKPTPVQPKTPADKFLAEKGTKAKPTKTGIPFDPKKFTKAAGVTSMSNGTKISTYTDEKGDIWIRGNGGMQKLRSADGSWTNKLYAKLNERYNPGTTAATSVASKTSEGTTVKAKKPVADAESVATSANVPINNRVASIDLKTPKSGR